MKVKIEEERELGKELSLNEEQELLTTEIKKLMMPRLNNNGKPYQSKIIGGISALCGRWMGDC